MNLESEEVSEQEIWHILKDYESYRNLVKSSYEEHPYFTFSEYHKNLVKFLDLRIDYLKNVHADLLLKIPIVNRVTLLKILE